MGKKLRDSIQYAGDFELKECTLITHQGDEVDLLPNIVNVNVFEDLMSSSLNADISFVDTRDAISLLPIVGNEYVKLNIGTPDVTKKGKINFTKHPFVVYKILRKVDVQQGSALTLKLTTKEIFLNLRKRVSQSYTGGYSEMVEKIFRDTNYLNSKKQLLLEETIGSHSLVIPNMRPFDAIRMIAQRSVSENSTSSFIFYETTRGYNFRTLESLYNVGPVFDYVVGEGADFQDEKSSKVNPMEVNFNQVEKNEFISNNDILTNTKKGVYASKSIVHDIYNKNYNVQTFSIKNEYDKKLDIESLGGGKGYPLFPIDSILDENDNKVSDYSDSRISLQSTSSDGNIFATSTYPNHRTPYGKTNPKESILNRFSKINLLHNGMKHVIQTTGNSGLEVGNIINLKIPKNQTGTSFFDEKLSGNYLILKLRHSFAFAGDKKHRLGMEVVKDSVKSKYPDSLPSSPVGKGETIIV